ncbi:hypothetical protein [Arthrobacter livingstonensis]|uniref:hypothetical protein n=1 Tax=Arthrobacter livingstonensis TaxID=670078 RepID=UPI0011B7FE58|nr:hypothetical protein [Arthrobacter livingstonensis]
MAQIEQEVVSNDAGKHILAKRLNELGAAMRNPCSHGLRVRGSDFTSSRIEPSYEATVDGPQVWEVERPGDRVLPESGEPDSGQVLFSWIEKPLIPDSRDIDEDVGARIGVLVRHQCHSPVARISASRISTASSASDEAGITLDRPEPRRTNSD